MHSKQVIKSFKSVKNFVSLTGLRMGMPPQSRPAFLRLHL